MAFGFGDMERPEEGRLLAGVCAAVSWTLSVDVTLVRLAVMLLALAKGAGLVIYLVLWLLLPSEGQGEAPWRQLLRINVRGMGGELGAAGRWLGDVWHESHGASWPIPLDRRWVAVGLVAGGGLLLLLSVGAFDWLGVTGALGLAAVALGGAVLLVRGQGPRR